MNSTFYQWHHHLKTTSPLLLILFLILTSLIRLNGQSGSLWLTSGQNISNTRNAKNEFTITPENVSNLEVKWVFKTGGDVSATPAVDDGYVYFPDWAGNLYKVDKNTGALVWSHQFSEYTGAHGDFARATPAISGNALVIGTEMNLDEPDTRNGAHVLCINKVTGKVKWITKVDDFFAAVITQSAVIYGNRVFVGVSSLEEGAANDSTYDCCSFRGSVVSLDLSTGAIIWKTYMVPDVDGFSGGAVWGSTPVIDPKRKSVYVTTGNDYTVPQAILDCVAAGGSSEEVKECISRVPGSNENYFDGLVALDINTGAVKYYTSVIPFDAWNVACLFEGPNCPDEAGPDYDFGQGPALFKAGTGIKKRELIGAGQKSGIYWAFDPNDGHIVWSTQVGPGGVAGGLQWGSATDGMQIYTAVSNSGYKPHTMTTGPGAGRTINGGLWAALNASTGVVNWENAGTNPPARPAPDSIVNPVAANMGPVSVANDVVFAGSMDSVGTMYAFDAMTGQVLWSFESGGSVISGAAISDGSVYWGSGYEHFNFGSPNNKLYAFKVGTVISPSLIHPTNTSPDEGATLQNLPNPFEQATDIYFEVPSTGRISIIVFDIFGNKIQTLVDEDLMKGEHHVKWEAAAFPSGIYSYRITGPGLDEVRKMLKI